MADALSQEEAAARLTQKLEAVFGAIERERMAGIPILNSRLRVAAIGMRPCSAGWVGVLVTPWFINAILLPASEADQEGWSATPAGTRVRHELPAGTFEFICGAEPDLGPYRMCSLFAPVLQFESHEAAIAAAKGAMTAFFEDRSAKAPQAQEAPPKTKKPQVTRRTLLFGRKDSAGGPP
jgi:[NiFe] hydrogenase assembly HybE family chaperone